jgi:hypothetical protein
MPKLSEVTGGKLKLSQVQGGGMVDTDFGPRPANEVVDVVSRPAPKPAKPSLFRMDSDFRKEAGLSMSDMLVASAKDMFGSRKGAADYLAQQYNKKHGLSAQINLSLIHISEPTRPCH